MEPNVSKPRDENQQQKSQTKQENKDDTRIYMNEKADYAEYVDGESDEWDSFSEGDIDEEKQALQQKKKPDEVIYATINDVPTNKFASEVMASLHLDNK